MSTHYGKVDFHSHYLSRTYVEYLNKYCDGRPDNYETPEWTEESHLSQMDELGIAFSFISLSSPNLTLADCDEEKLLAHQINTEGAEIAAHHPNRLGLLATVPLPNVQDAIAEAQYALDKLGAYGLGLTTNYAGRYLGSPEFDPLMEELDRRSCLVCVHPTVPQVMPSGVSEALPLPAMEYFFETTRTFVNMVLSNVFVKYPNIKWVFPHAGAFLSVLNDRFNGFSFPLSIDHPEIMDTDIFRSMRHVYFDLAGFSTRKLVPALLMDVDVSHLLYGSDAPYTPALACKAMTHMLETMRGVTARQSDAIMTGNAIRLVPRLASVLTAPESPVELLPRVLWAMREAKEKTRLPIAAALYRFSTATKK